MEGAEGAAVAKAKDLRRWRGNGGGSSDDGDYTRCDTPPEERRYCSKLGTRYSGWCGLKSA
jgi:hypothetical protein